MQNETYYLAAMLIIVAVALGYNLYGLWIIPEKYAGKWIKSVKDWWPFANFYRQWFASKRFIWLYRIIYSVFLLIVLTILGLVLFGLIGIFP